MHFLYFYNCCIVSINEKEMMQNRIDSLLLKIKLLLSWLRRKIELNQNFFNSETEENLKPYALEGEIYYAELGINIGAEIDKGRPVLVLQNDSRYVRRSNVVFVIPLSTNITPGPYKVLFKQNEVFENQGIVDSSVIIQQARTISKARLGEYKGRLEENKLREVALELYKYLFKINPLLFEEGNAQTIHEDAAKMIE